MSAQADDTFNIVILGGGNSDYACAFRASKLGLRGILVAKDKASDTRLRRTCISRKTLLHANEIADNAREGMKFDVETTFESVDMPVIHACKNVVLEWLYKSLQVLVKSPTIAYSADTGWLSSSTTVTFNDRTLTNKHVVLVIGSYTKTLTGLEVGGREMTSDQTLSLLNHVSAPVMMLGDGVIDVEFSSFFASFNTESIIVKMLPRLVAAKEEAVSKHLEGAFSKHKNKTRTGVRFASAIQSGNTIESDPPLVAVGLGITNGLGDTEADVTLNSKYILADEYCRCNVPGLQLMQCGFAQRIFVAENIADLSPTSIEENGILRVRSCDPEIASVGITEAASRETHSDVETYGIQPQGQRQEANPENPGLREGHAYQGQPARRRAHDRRQHVQIDQQDSAHRRPRSAARRHRRHNSHSSQPRTSRLARNISPLPGNRCTPYI